MKWERRRRWEGAERVLEAEARGVGDLLSPPSSSSLPAIFSRFPFPPSLTRELLKGYHLQDRHAVGHMMPQIDSQQDYELISLVENGGKTTMKFKRKFETCDPLDNAVQVNVY